MSDSFLEAEVAIEHFDAKLEQFLKIVEQFPDDKLWGRPMDGMSSLGNLACHVAGSMRDWLENGLAQKEWERDRQNEFDRNGGLNKAELIAHLNEVRQLCDQFLNVVDQSNWDETRPFRNKQFVVREIVWHQVEHVTYHLGQAAYLRRLVADLPAAP